MDLTQRSLADSVVKLDDDAGYNLPINIVTENNLTLYTAPTGTTAKGIEFAPLPSATVDSDGDGYTDFQEFLAGTNPHDPNSDLHIVSFNHDQNGYHVIFATVSGKKYRVQRNSVIPVGQGTVIADNLVANGPTIMVTDTPPNTSSHWFYRAVLIP